MVPACSSHSSSAYLAKHIVRGNGGSVIDAHKFKRVGKNNERFGGTLSFPFDEINSN